MKGFHPTWVLALAPAALLLAACGSSRGSAPVAIAVDSGVHYQRITGWEASTQAGQDDGDYARYRDRLMDKAVDLGISRLRLEVRSGAENPRDYWAEMRAGRLRENWRCVRYATVSSGPDPNTINWGGFHFTDLDHKVEQVVLPLKARLAARGERLFLNLEYVAFYGQCRDVPYIHTDPELYARFIEATSLHLRQKYGLVPDAWEVMLEPDNTRFWRGAQLGQALVATGRRLRAAGFTPRFIGPSTAHMDRASDYFDDLVKVPGALPLLSELSYHRYGGIGRSSVEAIAQRAERYHIDSAMLEHIGADYDELQRDLEIGRVSAWQQFALAFPADDNGAQYFVIEKSGGVPTVRAGSRTSFLRQYFHYIRPGAVRIGARAAAAVMAPLAFVNADGRFVVVVKADAGGSVAVAGLPAGPYTISYTTAAGSAPERRVALAAGAALTASIPDRGVLTIAGATAPARPVAPPQALSTSLSKR